MKVEVAILGGGFAGTLLALVLQRVGRSVVVLERGTHPRFAIGESSTPLGNLSLEAIARDFDLPRLRPLAEYGSWKRAYPHLACGLKRGFTFAQHVPGQPFVPNCEHTNELLVAASPGDEVGDTHWFRADFDHFLMQEARAAGIPLFDATQVTELKGGPPWHIDCHREEQSISIEAEFIVDASGPAGLLCRKLGIDCRPDRHIRTHSWSVFSHFEGVGLWADVLAEAGADLSRHPYRCDDAALHHVLEDGWVWVLRFDNGVTSAGVVYDGSKRRPDEQLTPSQEWQALLDRYPSIARQFAGSKAVRQIERTGRLQRRARRVAGPGWALLAHAAYFLDPLFSAGNAHTLLTIERLGRLLGAHWRDSSLPRLLSRYSAKLVREVSVLDRLVHGTYRCFGRPDLLASFTMNYFAAAIRGEERRRAGLMTCEAGFLGADLPWFRAALRRHEALIVQGDADALFAAVQFDLHSSNTAGLCDRSKRNMYDYVVNG